MGCDASLWIFPGSSASSPRPEWKYSRLRVQSVAQLSQISVPAIEQGGGLTVCGEVVVDQGGEPRDAVTQERVLSPMPFDGTLCPRSCGLCALMPAKGV